MVRDSFTWKFEGKVSEKLVLKEGWLLVRDSFAWNYRKGRVAEKVVSMSGLSPEWSCG